MLWSSTGVGRFEVDTSSWAMDEDPIGKPPFQIIEEQSGPASKFASAGHEKDTSKSLL